MNEYGNAIYGLTFTELNVRGLRISSRPWKFDLAKKLI